ncbi:MAG: hypothetical protein AAB545_01715 [Patescibacteria group bacterium]
MRKSCLKSVFFVVAFFFGGLFLVSPSQAAELSASRRAELEAELASIEKQIGDQKKILADRQKQSVSLERDVAILNAKIKESQLSIKARNIVIENLTSDIGTKQKTIGVLNEKLEREKDSLAQILRKTRDIESFSLAEFVLGDEDISGFFGDLDAFESINIELANSFNEVTMNRAQTEEAKEALEDKKDDEVNLRQIQELEKKKIEKQEGEKKNILKISRGLEKEYQKILSEKEKNAAAIRSALFSLTGSAAIPFGKALEYANVASKATGVRSALILGIIAEESNLGENVGKGTYSIDMHPTRDVPIFLALTKELGLDPERVPVSKKVWYGYGGAMGPAQFIPSTWILYAGYDCRKAPVTCIYNASKDRIGAQTGNRPPNPWNPDDAFMASATLMADNGATAGTRSSERLAALRYLAGWKNATKKAYAFYGDDVMELADKYQRQIDILASAGR